MLLRPMDTWPSIKISRVTLNPTKCSYSVLSSNGSVAHALVDLSVTMDHFDIAHTVGYNSRSFTLRRDDDCVCRLQFLTNQDANS